MKNLETLNWQPFEYKAKFAMFLKDFTKKVLKIYKSIVIEKFKPVPLCLTNGGSLKFLQNYTKVPF